MSFKDKLEKRLSNRERKSHRIEALDETVYWWPITAAERQQTINASIVSFDQRKGQIQVDSAKANAMLLVSKLEDEKGTKIFLPAKEWIIKLTTELDEDLFNELVEAVNPPRTPKEKTEEAKNDSGTLTIQL